MACTHDPRELAGQPIGMYHCPDCGEMVVAGMEHTPRAVLPDCLMPDGAEPCVGYQRLAALLGQAAEACKRAQLFARGTPQEHHYATLARELEIACAGYVFSHEEGVKR